jgi:hypothetical protein
MAKENYWKLIKKTFARWVNKTLNKTFTSQNIKLGFKVCKILLFNLKAMEDKVAPNTT